MQKEQVKLKHPINFGSETIDAVELEPLKAKHLRGVKVQNMSFDDFINVISRMTGLTDKQIDEMSSEDLMPLMEKLNSFLSDGQETGNTPLA